MYSCAAQSGKPPLSLVLMPLSGVRGREEGQSDPRGPVEDKKKERAFAGEGRDNY